MVPFVQESARTNLGLPDWSTIAARASDHRPAAGRISRRGVDPREALIDKRRHGLAGDGVQAGADRSPHAADQRISGAVAIEVHSRWNDVRGPHRAVTGRQEGAEHAPELGHFAAKCTDLALGIAPEIGQTVAVQIGRADPPQTDDRGDKRTR